MTERIPFASHRLRIQPIAGAEACSYPHLGGSAGEHGTRGNELTALDFHAVLRTGSGAQRVARNECCARFDRRFFRPNPQFPTYRHTAERRYPVSSHRIRAGSGALRGLADWTRAGRDVTRPRSSRRSYGICGYLPMWCSRKPSRSGACVGRRATFFPRASTRSGRIWTRPSTKTLGSPGLQKTDIGGRAASG